MSFIPPIAPIKVLLVPLQKDTRFNPLVQQLEESLDDARLSFKVDTSGVSIGKRYSRNDELGIPFGITIDYESLEGKGFTLRDRDSTKQVRAGLKEILDAVKGMVEGREGWEDVAGRLPKYEGKTEDE